MKLLVNGSRQSGPYIKTLWERAFRAFRLFEQTNVRSVLVLGIGGGTVIELLAKRYPRANSIAVDIDQTMIDIAKNYFHIDGAPNLQIVCADAKTFSSPKRFDLIIVDLFIGREIPAFVTQATWYERLKKMLSPHGILILNYLRELEYQNKSHTLFAMLKRIFSDVQDFANANNRFFLCRLLTRENRRSTIIMPVWRRRIFSSTNSFTMRYSPPIRRGGQDHVSSLLWYRDQSIRLKQSGKIASLPGRNYLHTSLFGVPLGI